MIICRFDFNESCLLFTFYYLINDDRHKIIDYVFIVIQLLIYVKGFACATFLKYHVTFVYIFIISH